MLFQDPSVGENKRQLLDAMARGFDHTTSSVAKIAALPDEIIPVVGCQMPLRDIELEWLKRGRTFVYWDRGYLNRGGKTWLSRGKEPEQFRFHVNAYQMRGVRGDVGHDRAARLRMRVMQWRRGGNKVVVACPSQHYSEFHRLGDWVERTIAEIQKQGWKVAIRQKTSRVPLWKELEGAYCLVTHGSVAAVEAVVFGCPVIVDPSCAAAPVGRTSLSDLGDLAYPDRTAWLNSLAYSQFTADEVADGTIWRHLR